MNISKYLWDIGIENKTIGDVEAEYLGLLQSKSQHSICSFVNDTKYMKNLSDCVKVVISQEKNSVELSSRFSGVCVVDNPREAFFKLHNYLVSLGTEAGYVREVCKSKIGSSCNISPLSYIAEHNVEIGNNVTIEEFVSIKENTKIEDDAIIRAGTVIGGAGFEYKKDRDSLFHVEHAGGVVIKKGVDIHHNAVVDRAIYPWDNTVIGEYTAIDDLVYIAHGVKLGKRVMIVANSSVAGRVEVGDDAWIGAGATIRNGISLGKSSRANMGAVVTKDVSDGESVSGNFAIRHDLLLENLKKSLD